MKKPCLSMLAIASLRVFAATPLPTQYIAPVANPTWEGRVMTAEYGTGKGFTYNIALNVFEGRQYCNFYIKILNQGFEHPYFVTWDDWPAFYYNDGYSNIYLNFEASTTWERSVISPANAPGKRYLYHARFDTAGMFVPSAPSRRKSCMVDAGVSWDYMFTKNGSDASPSGASFVQCVHTDWVYTVTFDANTNDFAGAMSDFVFTNSAALPACAFEKTGSLFSGWNTAPDGTGQSYTNKETAKSDLTLYAQWTAHAYTITLDDQGADVLGDTSMENVVYGLPLPKRSVTCPSRKGYQFGGYWTEPAGKGVQWFLGNGRRVDGAWNVPSDAVLYAHWVGIGYEVTFVRPDEDGYAGSMEVQEFTYGEAKPLSSNAFTRTGYSFAGWATVNGGSVKYRDMQVVSNLTDKADEPYCLYSKWTANEYSIEFDAQDGTGGTESASVKYGDFIPNVEIPVRSGFRFAGYYTEPDGKGVCYVDANGNGVEAWRIDADRKLYALWSDIIQTVAFNAAEGEFDDKSKKLAKDFRVGVPYGGEMPVPIDPLTNTMIFAGWWTSTNPVDRVQVTKEDLASFAVTNLYARWKSVVKGETCTLKFYVENDYGLYNVYSNVSDAVVGTEIGRYFPDPAPTADGGRRFFGWYKDKGGAVRVDESEIVTGNADFYAEWTLGDFNDAWGIRDMRFGTSTTGDGAKAWTVDILTGIAQSGYLPIGVNSSSTIVMNPSSSGRLSLEWNVSCPMSFAGLRLYINNGVNLVDSVNGDPGAFSNANEASVGSGDVVYLEYYRRPIDVSGYEDCGWARILKWTPDRTPTPVDDWMSFATVTAAVPDAVWSTGGAQPWATAEGKEIAAAGAISNGRTSWLKLETPAAKGVLSFKWKTSCEAGYVDTNGVYQACDYLEFFDDRGESQRLLLDGIQDGWTTVVWTNDVDSSHSFTWRYVKDGDVAVGDDAAWVKDVVWTPLSEETVVEYEYEEGGEVKHESVAVPNSWVDEYGLMAASGKGDYLSALNAPSGKTGCGGVSLSYWADYVAGTVPTNPASVFRVSEISVVDGTVCISWDPDWSDPAGPLVRQYTVWGKTNLTDAAWHTPTNSASRFFRVEVNLPKQ